MSSPTETPAARLLREIREKDSFFKALESARAKMSNSAREARKRLDAADVAQALERLNDLDQAAVDQALKALDAPNLRAAEVAKQLQSEPLASPMARRSSDTELAKALESARAKMSDSTLEPKRHADAAYLAQALKRLNDLDQGTLDRALKATGVPTLRATEVAKQLQVVPVAAARARMSPSAELTDALESAKARMNNSALEVHKRLNAVDVAQTLKRLNDLDQAAVDQALKALDAPNLRAAEVAKQLRSGMAMPAMARMSPDTNPIQAEIPLRSLADLGPMIRRARKAMKLSQGEFAAHAGVGRRLISELERGKGSIEFDKVLACALAAGVDVNARSRKS